MKRHALDASSRCNGYEALGDACAQQVEWAVWCCAICALSANRYKWQQNRLSIRRVWWWR